MAAPLQSELTTLASQSCSMQCATALRHGAGFVAAMHRTHKRGREARVIAPDQLATNAYAQRSSILVAAGQRALQSFASRRRSGSSRWRRVSMCPNRHKFAAESPEISGSTGFLAAADRQRIGTQKDLIQLQNSEIITLAHKTARAAGVRCKLSQRVVQNLVEVVVQFMRWASAACSSALLLSWNGTLFLNCI